MPLDRVRALAGLTDAQRLAVLAPPGPLLVLAGAGAGKTRVLTCRIAHWIACGTYAPAQVLAITFTNRAAGELAERLAGLLGPDAAGQVTCGTFHAVCHRLLRAHAAKAGRTPGFSVWDDGDRRRALRAVAGEQRLDLDADAAARVIALAKARLRTPEQLLAEARDDDARLTARAWAHYERLLADSDALDFDDLLAAAVRLLEQHPGVRDACRARWPAIVVDEYQDTNPAQARWLELLLGADGNLTACGDDDQAIYRFRSADVAHVLGFAHRHQRATVLALGTNHRSSGAIVAASRRLIEHNRRRHPKPLGTANPLGVPVRVERLADEYEEARAAALWCRHRTGRGLAPGALALLYRSRRQAAALQEALALAGVPHRTLGARGLLERAIVRDALAHLRLAVNPRDQVAFARAAHSPRRGLGPVAIAALCEHAGRRDGDLVAACAHAGDAPSLRAAQVRAAIGLAAASGSIARRAEETALGDTVIAALAETGLLRAAHAGGNAAGQLAALRALVRLARRLHDAEPEATLRELLAHTALSDDADADSDARVTLATVHAAKGLEWRAVRVVGLQEGLFPHARALQEGALEDERRLAYVAFTRAGEELALSWAAARHGSAAVPSRFLFESGAVHAQRARAA